MEECKLIKQWRSCSLETPPYLFPGDEFLVKETENAHLVSQYQSFDEFAGSKDLGQMCRSRLHLGLLPIPYVGDLHRSSIFILMLNPGFSPDDYYAEQHIQEYRDALVRNLHQDNADDEYPFLCLDPRFSWYSGFTYWHRKFREIAEELVDQEGTYQKALNRLAESVCCLQLVPYHSRSFSLPPGRLKRLQSAHTVVEYVRQVLVPKAERGEAVIVVARGRHDWDLAPQESIVVYEGSEPRAASLTLKSRGGTLIIEHLKSLK